MLKKFFKKKSLKRANEFNISDFYFYVVKSFDDQNTCTIKFGVLNSFRTKIKFSDYEILTLKKEKDSNIGRVLYLKDAAYQLYSFNDLENFNTNNNEICKLIKRIKSKPYYKSNGLLSIEQVKEFEKKYNDLVVKEYQNQIFNI